MKKINDEMHSVLMAMLKSTALFSSVCNPQVYIKDKFKVISPQMSFVKCQSRTDSVRTNSTLKVVENRLKHN